MNLYLNGVEDFSIVCADTLTTPAFLDGSHLRKFDIVLANPPYSIKQWSPESFSNDIYGRNIWGTPTGIADYAFFQHIVCSMNEQHGRCAILFPHGVLFRKAEKELRKKLVESDIIECVIALGHNLFYNSPMISCVIICKTNKSLEHKNKVLFIDAENDVSTKNGETKLEDSHIEKILNAYNSFDDIEGFSKVASKEEILSYDGQLSVSLYVEGIKEEIDYSYDDFVNEWPDIKNKVNKEIDNLQNLLFND